MQSVARALGVTIPDRALPAIALAAFIDMKYMRQLGGYKDDSVIDSIAYQGVLAELMKRLINNEPL